MRKVYKAHILFTRERNGFEVFENGYVAVEDGCVVGVSTDLSSMVVMSRLSPILVTVCSFRL